MLLILCDELSVWNRPKLTHEKLDKDSVCLKFDRDASIKSIKILIDEENSEMNLIIDKEKENSKDKKELIKKFDKSHDDHLSFFNNKNNNLEIFKYILDVK